MKFGTVCCKKKKIDERQRGFLYNGTETGRVREVQLQKSRMTGFTMHIM